VKGVVSCGWMDGRTDRTKLIASFRNYVKALKMYSLQRVLGRWIDSVDPRYGQRRDSINALDPSSY